MKRDCGDRGQGVAPDLFTISIMGGPRSSRQNHSHLYLFQVRTIFC